MPQHDNLVTITGNVATEPRVRVLDDGTTVCSFRLASTSSRWDRDSGGYVDRETAWLSVTAWRELGANCGDSLAKGHRVVVQGRLSTREWQDKDAATRTTVEVEALVIGPDLRWGRSTFTRVVRSVEVPREDRAEVDDLRAEVESDGRDARREQPVGV